MAAGCRSLGASFPCRKHDRAGGGASRPARPDVPQARGVPVGGAAAFGGRGRPHGPHPGQPNKKSGGRGRRPWSPLSGCRKSGLRHFFEVFIAPLRLRRGQGAMQGNPCYARLFADLTRMSPNPIIAFGGCGPRTSGGFSTGCNIRDLRPGVGYDRNQGISQGMFEDDLPAGHGGFPWRGGLRGRGTRRKRITEKRTKKSPANDRVLKWSW